MRSASVCCLLLATSSVLSSGCRGRQAASHQGRPGGILRLANSSDVQSPDPAKAYDTFSIPLVRLVYQGLLDYDDGVNLVPCLAVAMPVISLDGAPPCAPLRLRRGAAVPARCTASPLPAGCSVLVCSSALLGEGRGAM